MPNGNISSTFVEYLEDVTRQMKIQSKLDTCKISL